MDWCRLWHDMPTDPKWRVIAKRSGQTVANVLAVWSCMLVNASSAANRGTLEGWEDEDVAAGLDLEPEAVTAIREAMQGKVLEGEHLSGWERRQPKREDDGATERKRKQRARDKAGQDDVSRDVTQGHAPEEIRGEEIRESSSLRSEGADAQEDESPSRTIQRLIAAGHSAEETYWALKGAAAKEGITGSLMGRVLRATGDPDIALAALEAAIAKRGQAARRYFGAVATRREQREQLATADHAEQWRAAGIPERMIRELRPGDHVVKRECTYIVNQGLPTERQYWLDGSPERDG